MTVRPFHLPPTPAPRRQPSDFEVAVGVQTNYDVVHLRTSLVQLFVLLQLNFEEVVQIIELRRFGGAPNGYPFAALGGRQSHAAM
jgi:hypothetical protein